MAKKGDNSGENKKKATGKKSKILTEHKPVETTQKKTEKSSQPDDNGGQFKKGHKKMGGRKAGTKNKVTTDIRKLIIDQITPRIEKLGNDLDKMEPAERVAALAHWANYVIPKYSNTTINGDSKRDIGTEEMLKQLNGEYQRTDITIDITKIKIVNNQ